MSTGKEHAQMCLSTAGKPTTGNMKQIFARITKDGTDGLEATGSIDKQEAVDGDGVDKQTKETSPGQVSQKQTESNEASKKLKRKRGTVTCQRKVPTKAALLSALHSWTETQSLGPATDVDATAPQVAQTAASSGQSNQNGTKALSSAAQANELPSESVKPAAVKAKPTAPQVPNTVALKTNALLPSPTEVVPARNVEERLAILAAMYKDKLIGLKFYETAQAQILTPCPINNLKEIFAVASSAVFEWGKARDQGMISHGEFANVKAQIMEQVRAIANDKAGGVANFGDPTRAISKERLISRLNACFQDKIALIRGLMSDKIELKDVKEDDVVAAFVTHIFAGSEPST